MLRRRFLKLNILATIVALSFIGCGNNEDKIGKEKDKSSLTASPTDESQRQEPSLSKSAKKLTQFAKLKEGDLIAKILVKDYGTLKIKLFLEQAPKAVENFVTHAKNGYYNGLSFHRVIDNFMIQGGDPKGTGAGGESIWGAPFEDEFSDELYPYRGALCMANSGKDTNGSQFFVVQADELEVKRLQDLVMERYKLSLIDYVWQGYETAITQEELQAFLTYGGTPWLTRHHTVFGQLIEGFEVLDSIAETKLADPAGIPEKAVIIESIQIAEYQGE